MSQISNKFLAQIPANSLKGNNTGSTANVTDLTISQVQTMLSIPTASSPLAIGSGGTGQTTANAGFNALSPMTTGGDLIYGGASGAGTRLANGTSGQVLTSSGTTLAPTWTTPTVGANTALSNLSAVAINTALLPVSNATIDLGSSSLNFRNAYIRSLTDGSGFVSSSVQNRSLNDSGGTASLSWASVGTISVLPGVGFALDGATSGAITLKANASTTSYTVLWPAAQGAASTFLQNDGSGNLSWASAGSSGITALTGDVTATGPGSAAATLATVNSNVGSFGSSTSIPSFTVNGKGLITAASGNVVVAPAGTLSGTTLNSTVVTSSLTSLGTQASALNMGSQQINAVLDPTSPQDAATKNYVDNLSNGLSWKNPVRAISTTNITLSGAQTIDGVSIIAGDRVLVAGQTTTTQNGIYVAASGAWSRSSDASTGAELVAAATFVDEGTVNSLTAWVQNAPAPITIGTTAISFTKFSNVSYTFGNGLNLTGNTVTVLASDSSILSAAGGVSVVEDAAGAIVTGGSGIKVQVDSVTSKINGSNQIESLKQTEQLITLVSGDITNQFVDLSHAVYGTSASINSIELTVIGGPLQQKTVDYTVSLTGGSGGVTRVTFAGDLATGGNAALVSGDKLAIYFSYLT